MVRPTPDVLIRLALGDQSLLSSGERKLSSAKPRSWWAWASSSLRRERGPVARTCPEPPVRVLARVGRDHAIGHARAERRGSRCAARDQVAVELVLPRRLRRNGTRGRIEGLDAGLTSVASNSGPCRETRGNQVLDHLDYPVDHDRAESRRLRGVEPATLAVELQVDAVVDQSFAVEALREAVLPEEVDNAPAGEAAGAQQALDIFCRVRRSRCSR